MSATSSPIATSDRPFAGALGADYQFIKLMCPNVPLLHGQIGTLIAASIPEGGNAILEVVELGCGTGLLTASILALRDKVHLLAMDLEPTMLEQARTNLGSYLETGQLSLSADDALACLSRLAPASVDIVASAYCCHNFDASYRQDTLQEILRVLKPGGLFINGDRYALDEPWDHTQCVQREVVHFCKTFRDLNRLDLLEHWIVHLLADESPERIMREGPAVQQLRELGFNAVQWHFRDGVDGLLTATKPLC